MSVALLAVVVVGLSELAAIGGLVVIRRLLRPKSLHENQEVGGIIFGVVGTAYAVLLSFVLVSVWGQFQVADSTARQEAGQLGSIFWLAQGLPQPARGQIQRGVGNYAETVVRVEWPLMGDGKASDEAWSRADDLWNLVLQVNPQDAKQGAIYNRMLDARSSLDSERRVRLGYIYPQLPTSVLALIVLGGATLIGFTYLFETKHLWTQMLMTAILTGLLATVLFLVAGLNSVYGGAIGVKPVEFQSIVDLVSGPIGPGCTVPGCQPPMNPTATPTAVP